MTERLGALVGIVAVIATATFGFWIAATDVFDRVGPDARITIPEEGDPLDPSAASWLDPIPDRTRVDVTDLRDDLEALEAELREAAVIDGAVTYAPLIDRVATGHRSSRVLIGAVGTAEFAPTPTAAKLEAIGFTANVDTFDEIRTTYPLVSPAPQGEVITAVREDVTVMIETTSTSVWLTFGIRP